MNIVLENKVVVVTGGARGVGRGIAREMGYAGSRVVIADIDEAISKEATKILGNEGLGVDFEKFDLTDEDSCRGLVERVVKKYGRIDVLVNNAGVVNESGFLGTSVNDLRRVFEVNFFGGYALSQMVARDMIEKKIAGSILFTSSTHQQVTMLRPAYSASKSALGMLIKEMALELTPRYGIRVNAVAPGVVAVHGQEDLHSDLVPIGCVAVPEDIGRAMVFLSSDAAGHITGHTLFVDGGFSLIHTHYWMNQEKL